MKRLLLPLAILAIAPAAYCQELSGSLFAMWDLRTKTTSFVALRPIGKIDRPLGLNIQLDVDGFAGADTTNNMIGGFSVGKTFDLATNIQFKFALAATTSQSKPVGIGLIIGLGWRF